jgi:hypothetical protein
MESLKAKAKERLEAASPAGWEACRYVQGRSPHEAPIDFVKHSDGLII